MFRIRRESLALPGLLAAVALIYAPVFRNGFLYDDYENIVLGEVVHDPSRLPALFFHHALFIRSIASPQGLGIDSYRPISVATFMWDSLLSGRSPWAYHLTNLLLHMLAVALVYHFVRRVLNDTRGRVALGCAGWFAVTPHPATAHVWINGRSDVLMVVFVLGSLLVYRQALEERDSASRARTGLRHGLALLLFACALMSKELAITMLVPLLLWPEVAPTPLVTRLRRVAGYAVVALVYMVVRQEVLGGMRAGQGTEHLPRVAAYFAPLQWQGMLGALVPRGLHLRFMQYDFSRLGAVEVAAYWGALLLALGALLWARKRAPKIVWGVVWFGATLSPIAVIAAVRWPGFGRYLYLPSVGLAVALGAAVQLLLARVASPARLRALGVALAAYLATLVFLLEGWIADHHDRRTFYDAAIVAQPDNPFILEDASEYAFGDGRTREALGMLSRAHALRPEDPGDLRKLMEMYAKTGQSGPALQAAEEGASAYDDGSESFHLYLASAYASDPQRAAHELLECLRKDPGAWKCGSTFTDFATKHRDHAAYVAAARQVLSQPQYAELRARMAPLMDTLPR